MTSIVKVKPGKNSLIPISSKLLLIFYKACKLGVFQPNTSTNVSKNLFNTNHFQMRLVNNYELKKELSKFLTIKQVNSSKLSYKIRLNNNTIVNVKVLVFYLFLRIIYRALENGNILIIVKSCYFRVLDKVKDFYKKQRKQINYVVEKFETWNSKRGKPTANANGGSGNPGSNWWIWLLLLIIALLTFLFYYYRALIWEFFLNSLDLVEKRKCLTEVEKLAMQHDLSSQTELIKSLFEALSNTDVEARLKREFVESNIDKITPLFKELLKLSNPRDAKHFNIIASQVFNILEIIRKGK